MKDTIENLHLVGIFFIVFFLVPVVVTYMMNGPNAWADGFKAASYHCPTRTLPFTLPSL